MTKRTKSKLTSLKENVIPSKMKASTANKNKLVENKTVKPIRRAFVDKTNSASDDNASSETPQKRSNYKTRNAQENLLESEINNNKDRPRRERRIPPRFIGYLSNISISNDKKDNFDIDDKLSKSPTAKTLPNNNSSCETLNKTPKNLDSLLSYSRPRRICRLPSKFEDHDISIFTSQHGGPKHNNTENCQSIEKNISCIISEEANPKHNAKKSIRNIHSSRMSAKCTALNNDVSANLETLHENVKRKHNMVVSTPINNNKLTSEPSKNTNTKKLLEKNTSFRLLENKRRSPNTSSENVDVYEFTYDPNEEPPPKKKKKRAIRKKPPAKQKTFIFKNNYDINMSKALASLKNVVSKNSAQTPVPVNNDTLRTDSNRIQSTNTNDVEIKPSKTINSVQSKEILIKDKNLETSQDHDNINYSPVNSPNRSKNTFQSFNLDNQNVDDNNIEHIHNNDPLNLQEELSFFDVPVASSSMNMSARRQMASPWRVEFENLPIKWQVNTYVKPNMTPAVESSFINFNESKKKHVYTNIDINPAEETFDTSHREAPKLQQPSIISFLKEVIERSAKKKRRGISVTPTKANPVQDNMEALGTDVNYISTEPATPEKDSNKELATPDEISPQSTTSSNKSLSSGKNKFRESRKHKHNVDQNNLPNTPLNVNKKNSYFGFDVTDSPDKENVNENIDKKRLQALRPRARAVLQEFNQQMGPSRVVIPVSKSKFASNSEAVNKLYEGIKSATDAPAIPDIIVENFSESTNDALWQNVVESDNSQSVHLFEDIEVVHHLKPSRKSYGKEAKNPKLSKKEQSQKTYALETTKQKLSKKEQSQINYGLETTKQKLSKKEPFDKSYPKKTRKQKQSKKEQQEADAWAAGFNSMCEDIDEFDLVVE